VLEHYLVSACSCSKGTAPHLSQDSDEKGNRKRAIESILVSSY
jgi:hypothetical protein